MAILNNPCAGKAEAPKTVLNVRRSGTNNASDILLQALDGLDHIFDHLLGVTKHHHGLIEIEQLIVQAGVT